MTEADETLICAECGRESDQRAAGWRAILGEGLEDDPDPDYHDDAVEVFCPECAKREFGPEPHRTGSKGVPPSRFVDGGWA